MKVQLMVVVFSLMIMVLWVPSMAVADQQSETKAFLASCIEKELASCCCKMEMIDSRSKCIRDCCRMAMLKARFIIDNSEELINEMLENGIAGKCYKVDHYVNQRFLESLETEPTTAQTTVRTSM
jgi:hypothetical protein